jgi:hypothetical protein
MARYWEVCNVFGTWHSLHVSCTYMMRRSAPRSSLVPYVKVKVALNVAAQMLCGSVVFVIIFHCCQVCFAQAYRTLLATAGCDARRWDALSQALGGTWWLLGGEVTFTDAGGHCNFGG